MRSLPILVSSLLLSACSTTGQHANSTLPAAKQAAQIQSPARIQMYVPAEVRNERFTLEFDNGASVTLEPGRDLQNAASDVGALYFADSAELDLNNETDFILKLSGESFMAYDDVTRFKGQLQVALMNRAGEILDESTITRLDSAKEITANAFYGLYAEAISAYLDQLNSEQPELLAKSAPAKPDVAALVLSEALELNATGTGFFINDQGNVITNQHVVEQCLAVTIAVNGETLISDLIISDADHDIAVLSTDRPQAHFARFNDSPRGERLGEEVMALGYPLYGVLSSSINLTTGNISSLLGVQDDESVYQITAPIQAGNSGGPLLNQRGLVAGMVQSKLNALEVSRYTGDLAQNVNFAIKSDRVKQFLSQKHINFYTGHYEKAVNRSTADLAEEARDYTVQIKCHG